MKPILREINETRKNETVRKKFNENGQISCIISKDSDGTEYETIYEYDNNILVSVYDVNEDNTLKTFEYIHLDGNTIIHEFNRKTNDIISEQIYDKYNNLVFEKGENGFITKNNYEYDDEGKIIKSIKYEEFSDQCNTACISSDKYFYNDKNDIISILHYVNDINKFSNIKPYNSEFYSYDYYNKSCTYTNILYDDVKISETVTKYKDKINGKILERYTRCKCIENTEIKTKNDSYNHHMKECYTYDNNDRLIKVSKDNDNTLSTTNYEYYKDTDILLKEVSSNGDIVEYIYDNLDI